MKTIAYSALAYGLEYIEWSIRSVIDDVDEYIVLYTPHGSYGHRTNTPCPESRMTLLNAAYGVAGHKLSWFDGDWTNEGQHRNTIHEAAPHADIILSLDYDEIWQDGLPQLAIETALRGTIRNWRVPMRHYWRSFRRCVLHDPAFPTRVINTHFVSGEQTLETNGLAINHLGYAISPRMMDYKWQIHGHKNELRKDVNWYQDRFLANAQADCHPVGSEWWTPESVNPLDFMPAFMQEHPYYNLEVIE